MCGISFIYDTEEDEVDNGAIDLMVECIHHRGPDFKGILNRKNAALGHTRLSIVDVKGGQQPMVSIDGRYSIIYNGEIYNYQALKKHLEKNHFKFTTLSDTEVVLNMFIDYGPKCVSFFRGMFSFAIHDNKTGHLFVARDRLGIKPLFYHWNGRYLIASSEIKAIFASGFLEPKLNMKSIVNFFKYQFSIAPYTPFENIYELEPGCSLNIEPGGAPVINRYWDLVFPEQNDYESLQESYWLSKYISAIDDAVVSHMIGEVPMGAYMSGGIDSATTTYLLNKHYDKEVRSFTIGFTDKVMDESQIAKNIADEIGVSNSQLFFEDDRPGGYLGLLINAIYYLEQPQRVAVDIPYLLLSDYARSNNCKVIFAGDGADETLAGYDCYKQDSIRISGNKTQNQFERNLYYRDNYAGIFSQQYLNMIARLHESSRQQQTMERFGCYPVWFDIWNILEDYCSNIFSEDVISDTQAHSQMTELSDRMKPHISNRHSLNQSLYIETKTRLPGWILWKSDRLSMANGVEARVPFMDHQLVELTAQIPPELKLKGMEEKYILKQAMLRYLPKHPYQFRKRAFYTPIKEWFFTSKNIRELQKFMDDSAIRKTGIFNPEQVKVMMDGIAAFENPISTDEYYSLMRLEWGLMLVLTTQILHWLYVDKHAPCFKMKTKPQNA